MSDHTLLVVFLVVLVLIAVRTITKLGGGSLTVLRGTMGRSARARERDMAQIARFWRRSLASAGAIDDRTWTDLDMDAVFASVDRTETGVGQQVLYARMRAGGTDPAALRRFDEAVGRVGRDDELRAKLVDAVRRLDDSRSLMLPALFEEAPGARPALWRLMPLLTVGAVGCLLLVDAYPRAALLLLAIAIVNLIVTFVFRRRIDPIAPALHMAPQLIRAGRALAAIECDELREELDAARRHVARLDRLYLATAWLAFEPGQANEIVSTVYQYANMVFGLDADAFVFGVEQIRLHREDLRALFEAVGAIDATLAVSAWRAELAQWCRPELTPPRKKFSIAGIVHPLVPDAVPNDLESERSVLVTGSNMSGKTTFIRAVGVNAILAQTLATALATRWVAPRLRVRSSIGRSDDVQSGKSYYLAEVESIGRLVAAARNGVQHLFLIDEIFRGTNTTERIAAGEAVLAWLDAGDNIVLVATHDLELLDALAGRYAPFHFREQIEGDALHFDYIIRPGASSTRNAIELLRLMRFPEPLVRDALRAVERNERPAAAD